MGPRSKGLSFTHFICLPYAASHLSIYVLSTTQVLSKAELQFLALLPSLRPNVRVIAECGNW